MKILRLLLLLTLVTHSSLSQGQDTLKYVKTKNETVSFVTTINIKWATVDGIYIKDYVVNIPYDRLLKLNGKEVRISGKVTIIEGLKNKPPTKPLSSGRYNDTKHILNPRVKIIRG